MSVAQLPPAASSCSPRAPVAGYAKTRLIPALGEQGAADLAQRMLNHAVHQALECALGRG